MTSFQTRLTDLCSSLYKESFESKEPDAERCTDIFIQIEALITEEKNKVTIEILEKTQVGKTIAKSLKALKRHRRSVNTTLSQNNSPDSEKRSKRKNSVVNQWDVVCSKCESLLSSWKEAAKKEAYESAKQKQVKVKEENRKVVSEVGRPTSVSSLHSRLTRQKKEIYKNPPVLPPPTIVIHSTNAPRPKRNDSTGELVFKTIDEALDDTPSINLFRPNLTPSQILQGGAFGGTYFRSITSAITNKSYHSTNVISTSLEPEWIQNLTPKIHLSSQTYRTAVNKYKAKCGGSLGMWESSGWISDVDPYGWFQWYCRFYSGRRCSDDERQIGRWCKIAGVKGRFLSQLCNKCLKAGKLAGDASVSPVIRQTLWHWGVVVTDKILERHRKRIGGK